MHFSDNGCHIRKLKLFIPPSESPLLTTYGKMVLPKLSPMKQKYEIFSKRTQSTENSNPETQYLSAHEISRLNRSFEAIKKSRGQDVRGRLKESQYHLDPLYKSIIDMKSNANRSQAHSERKSSLGSSLASSFSP